MMRKIFGAVLAIGLAVAPAPARAGIFCCRSKCCDCCGATFCVRQANAFSPVASGNLYLDGILPFGTCQAPCSTGCCPSNCCAPFPNCGPCGAAQAWGYGRPGMPLPGYGGYPGCATCAVPRYYPPPGMMPPYGPPAYGPPPYGPPAYAAGPYPGYPMRPPMF